MFEDESTQVPAVLRRAFPEARIIAAIPAFNEGPTIGSVVLKTRQFASQVVVVDDGSTDDTAETAALAGAHVIQHARNLGKGLAIRSAWLYAREQRPDAFVLIDGDHQHDPNDIPRLVGPILSGQSDVVLGVRWGKTSHMPAYRRLGKRVLDVATAAAIRHGSFTDSQSGFRAFARRSLRELEPEQPGLAIESQMLVEAQEKHLRITQVSIDARYDIDGSTIKPGKHGMRVLAAILNITAERRPLLYFGIPGIGMLTLAAYAGIRTVEAYYDSGFFLIGYAFLFVFFGFLGTLTLFTATVLNSIKHLAARDK